MNARPTDADDRLIGAIRAIDPCPDELAGPPSELVTRRLHQRGADPRGHRRFRLRPLVALAPVAVALAVAAVAVTLLGQGHSSGPRRAGSLGAPVRSCRSALHFRVLPVWARTGFSDPPPREEFAVGRRDRIGAILFGGGDYLDSPPATGHTNKILWVSRVRPRSAGAFTIRAQRMRGTRRVGAPVTRTVPGGPGPSIINLPAVGCWRLTLRWSGWTDQVDLSYERPS
jgi:hypothetical protein